MKNSPESMLFETACRKTIPGYEQDEKLNPIKEKLLAFITRTQIEGVDIDKGLMIIGNVGTGKTTLMQSVQTMLRETKNPLLFKLKPTWHVASDFGKDGFEVLDKYRTGHWMFDELGMVERETVRYYGNNVNVADVLIHERYNAYRNGWLTHFTTNLTKDELQQKYDPRTFSRLMEMCNLIPYVGRDRRIGIKGLPQKPLPKAEPEVNSEEVLKDPEVREWIKGIKENMKMIGNKHKLDPVDLPGITMSKEEEELRKACQKASIEELETLSVEFKESHPVSYQIITDEIERKRIENLPNEPKIDPRELAAKYKQPKS